MHNLDKRSHEASKTAGEGRRDVAIIDLTVYHVRKENAADRFVQLGTRKLTASKGREATAIIHLTTIRVRPADAVRFLGGVPVGLTEIVGVDQLVIRELPPHRLDATVCFECQGEIASMVRLVRSRIDTQGAKETEEFLTDI